MKATGNSLLFTQESFLSLEEPYLPNFAYPLEEYSQMLGVDAFIMEANQD